MKPIRQTCVPRPEVLKGDLEDALFAANFGHVLAGIAPKVYQDAETFFRNTYPTELLRKLVGTIFQRLADPHEAGAPIRLSTGFGGGKTHTLIALWHLARHIDQTTLGTELLPAAGRPQRVVVAGIDADGFGAKVCATHGTLQTHSLWGELAYQLGGVEGYRRIQELDSPTSMPDRATLRAILPDEPLLILLDELVIYMAVLDDQAQGQLLAFLNMLISEITARRQAVLVITDPAGQPAYSRESRRLAESLGRAPAEAPAEPSPHRLREADERLGDVLGRTMSNYEVIGREGPQVILRRLFERIDGAAAEEASAEYYRAYQRVSQEYAEFLPQEAATRDYAQRIVQCYPFHPRLLETAQNRLGALQDFNQSRGVLRLFARMLRDIWESGSDVPLITAGDLDWSSRRIQADLLERLKRDPFKAAVEADIEGHARELDRQHATDIHRRVASALLLESLPLTDSAAMDKRELTLAVLRPSDVGHEPAEALDRLLHVCWHTYKTEGGLKAQFRYEPNALKIIEERARDPHLAEDARRTVLSWAQSYFSGHLFSLVAYPSSPRAVADSARLQLVLADSEPLAQAICDYEDDSDPAAKMPRRFRNAILAVAPTPQALEEAVRATCRLKAAEEVAKEHKKGTPVRQQVEELLPIYREEAARAAIRAFNRVCLQGRPSLTLAERYQVDKERPLGQANGQERLMDFLNDNRLIYQRDDALDVDLLVEELLPGATPSLEHPGAYSASALHERALAHRSLKLMADESPVRNAVLKAVAAGRLVVRLANGDVYDREGAVRGAPGSRQRFPGERLTTLRLTGDVLLAPPGAPCLAEWLRVDERPTPEGALLALEEAAAQKGATVEQVREAADLGQVHVLEREGRLQVVDDEAWRAWAPPDLRRQEVVADTWEKALAYAPRRALKALTFKARSPAAADKLLACAQPFGAPRLTLSLWFSGELKEGGQVHFSAQGVPHNAPLRPLELAKTMARACKEEGASYEARLELELGGGPHPPAGEGGRRGTEGAFAQAQAQGGRAVQLEAHFGPEEDADVP